MAEQEITLGNIIALIKDIFSYLRKKIKLVIIFSVCTALLGMSYALVKKTRFKAEISFFLNEKENIMAAGLSGIAGQFLGMSSEGDWPSEDKIKDLVFTKRILTENLLTGITVQGRKEMMVNHFIKVNKFENAFSSDTILNGFTEFKTANPGKLSFQEVHAMDLIINFIRKSKMIKVSTTTRETIMGNKGGGIISFEVITKSEVLSKEFSTNLLRVLSEFYIHKSIQRERSNYDMLSKKADSVKTVLEIKESELAQFNDRSLGMIRSMASLDKLRLQRDIQILNVMYAEVLKNKETMKFTLDLKTPIFQIIDNPEYPLEIIKPFLGTTSFIGFICGLIIISFILVVKKLFFL